MSKEVWQKALDDEVTRLIEEGWDEEEAERDALDRAHELFQSACESYISAAEALRDY